MEWSSTSFYFVRFVLLSFLYLINFILLCTYFNTSSSDNSHPSFEDKLDALVSRIAGELGLPHPRQESETTPPTISYTLEV